MRRRRVHMIAVAHPYRGLLPCPKSLEQAAALDSEVGPAVFAPAGAGDISTGEMSQQLHSVAEAQHRRAQLEQLGVGGGNTLAIDRIGSAREDDSLGLPLANPVHRAGRGMDLTVHVSLPHPSGNELSVLGAEIDDQDAVVMRFHWVPQSRETKQHSCAVFNTKVTKSVRVITSPIQTNSRPAPGVGPPTTFPHRR